MPPTIPVRFGETASSSLHQLLQYLQEIRQIHIIRSESETDPELLGESLLEQLKSVTDILHTKSQIREAEALSHVSSLTILSSDFGGLGYSADMYLDTQQEAEVVFLVSAWLESLNSVDRSQSFPKPLASRPEGRRGMTLSEKIFAAHDLEQKGVVTPGDVIRVSVDWILASELSWNGMERAYNSLGKPGLFRNDRFWLAGDHVVEPRVNHLPKVQALLASSKRAKEDFRMTDYQGNNYTIMHTEFCRERVQPGMLVIGSDSHTCSAGSMGALAIGLGVADVTMPLITGESWFKIPGSVNIQLINAPRPGIGGKDTILYIMKELKRNTIAADRVVEFTGPGVAHLSCDARFAIANMTTEFGGISGIFVPDEITDRFIQRRRGPRNKIGAQYFRPDEDAEYAASHLIDLAQEDLIIGALVLEAGLKLGLVPASNGKRKVVPGSLPILNRLKSLGLSEIYEQAGFEIGVPGCSYCVGMGADKADAGEVWISSQNRNFENRMGPGAIGHIGSAATVAASSFSMTITDPQPLLDLISHTRLQDILEHRSPTTSVSPTRSSRKPVSYVEPGSSTVATNGAEGVSKTPKGLEDGMPEQIKQVVNAPQAASVPSIANTILDGRIQLLGDFIDTDALAPSAALTTCITDEEFGRHCLEHTHPGFRERAKEGFNVVVAGNAFGCGSSRDCAVSALKGCGIVCVIAKSFAFIYGRNQPNLGLLGITITDESFYDAAIDGEDIKIDLEARKITVGGGEWAFNLSAMEMKLIEIGGITGAFRKFGKRLFEVMCAPIKEEKKKQSVKSGSVCESIVEIEW
ncbi:Uncharacterized protein BP5553_01533 [Venustampulla echinocandica]|uniref:Aconitase family protein n=1 Tax=Venustampulla echinocandica TaxID=2656787 RepID=A0A370U1B2_9HELO|nr:Uncharacterized protein BP5553_01533 [Venustampulla echinocandica]RDL41554.1 Uncharacterized protein BP5553_01533 [Venustampulla echinocandica]